jgi:hypothetical protein
MRVLTIALLLVSGSIASYAQKFGARENLAPYVPTPQFLVERMLEAGRVSADDVVYDLGSGDGRIVITAAQKYGARAVGVEGMPDLCRQSRQRILALGLGFLTSSNERLKPNLEKYLRPGARVVSNQFPIHGWKPIAIVHVKQASMDHAIFVYQIGKTK